MPHAAQKPLTTEEVYRRAGGRRRYNKQRQAAASWQQLCLLMALDRLNFGIPPGQIAAWAAEHQVSTKTIYLDLRRLRVREQQRLRSAIFERLEERYRRRW
jgi:hypothetical protein